jgi:hypothetical protein
MHLRPTEDAGVVSSLYHAVNVIDTAQHPQRYASPLDAAVRSGPGGMRSARL